MWSRARSASRRTTRSASRARTIRQAHGLILHPFEAFLLTRGLRTLDLRVRAAADNAMELAGRLSNHAAVSAVLYPGLPHHPGHDVARRQMKGGFGGMLSIRVRGGAEAAIATAARVTLVETRDVARRGRIAYRTPRLDRGRGARPARPTCCGSPPASRTSRTSGAISTRR